MNINDVIKGMMSKNKLDLDDINFYLAGCKNKTLSEEEQKRFLLMFQDKLMQLHTPNWFSILNQLKYNNYCYSKITAIEMIEGKIIIKAFDDDYNYRHLLISNYNSIFSYDSYMHDGMFTDNDDFSFEEATQEEKDNYEQRKNSIYAEYANIINKAFEQIGIKQRLIGGDGYYGVASFDENYQGYIEGYDEEYSEDNTSKVLNVYGNDYITDIVRQYQSDKGPCQFDFLYVDSNLNLNVVKVSFKQQQVTATKISEATNLLTYKGSLNRKNYKDNYLEQYDFYQEQLNILRANPFSLKQFNDFYWTIKTPPYYIHDDKWYFGRPVDIAIEKLIQLLNIPYEDAKKYMTSLISTVNNYHRDLTVGIDYPEYLPKTSFDDKVKNENAKLLTLLKDINKSTTK